MWLCRILLGYRSRHIECCAALFFLPSTKPHFATESDYKIKVYKFYALTLGEILKESSTEATNNGKAIVASQNTFTLCASGFILAQLIASSWFPPESEPSNSEAVVM